LLERALSSEMEALLCGSVEFTELTEAVNDNTDSISKHRLSPAI